VAPLNAKTLVNKSTEELKALLVEQGVDINYYELAQAQAAAEDTIALPVPPAERSENKIYKWLVSFSRVLTEALSIVQIAFIQGLLAPLMTFMLAYVEWDRMRIGIEQFDSTHANLLAGVAILAYIVLTIIQAHHEAQHNRQQREAFTMKRIIRGVGQFLFGNEKKYVTELNEIRGIITIIRWLIVISASFGSLQGQFNSEAVSFQDVLDTVAGDFRIATGVVIVGLFALSLLQGLHWSLYRVYEIKTGLVGDTEVGDNRNFLAEQQRVLLARQQVGEEAVKMKLIQLILEQRQQQKSQSVIPELTEPMSYSNGSHSS